MAAHRARRASRTTYGGTGGDWLSRVAMKAAPGGAPPAGTRAPTGRAEAADAAACTLTNESESAKAARDFAAATLRGWSLEELTDGVGVAASELVTNALHHGLADSVPPEEERTIRLGLLLQGRCVLCAVYDPGADVPTLKEPDLLAETGRGLHVVAAVSDAWGWTPADSSGKVVWTRFSVPDRPPNTAGPSIAGSYVDNG